MLNRESWIVNLESICDLWFESHRELSDMHNCLALSTAWQLLQRQELDKNVINPSSAVEKTFGLQFELYVFHFLKFPAAEV